jgi:hypothetical protein
MHSWARVSAARPAAAGSRACAAIEPSTSTMPAPRTYS